MGTWTDEELEKIDSATELRVTSRRPDGTLRPFVPIWHTTIDDALYIRSAAGPQNGWFRRALASGLGRIDAGGVVKDVTFQLADRSIRTALDEALHRKYDLYGPQAIGAITGDD